MEIEINGKKFYGSELRGGIGRHLYRIIEISNQVVDNNIEAKDLIFFSDMFDKDMTREDYKMSCSGRSDSEQVKGTWLGVWLKYLRKGGDPLIQLCFDNFKP